MTTDRTGYSRTGISFKFILLTKFNPPCPEEVMPVAPPLPRPEANPAGRALSPYDQ